MWLESYTEHLKIEDKSASTNRAVKSDLRGLQRWRDGIHQRSFDIRRLTQRDVRLWIQHRQQVDAARPSTINRGLSSLRTYSRWAVSEGLLVENPRLCRSVWSCRPAVLRVCVVCLTIRARSDLGAWLGRNGWLFNRNSKPPSGSVAT
jgi:hypothetical protein